MTTPKVSSPRTQRKSGADFTGKNTEKLNAALKVERQDASSRMAMVASEAVANKDTIIDLTNPENPVTEVQVREVEVDSPKRLIRTNTTLNQVTWGRQVVDEGDPVTGRPAVMGPMVMYDFEEGQAYKIPRELADHLNERGYLSYLGGA